MILRSSRTLEYDSIIELNHLERKRIRTRFVCLFVGVAVTVVLGTIGVSEAIGTAMSWVNVVDGVATIGSFWMIGTGGGGCITWKVGCSSSSDVKGNDTFEGSDDSTKGGTGAGGTSGNSWEVEGSATGAGNESTCILFEQYEYLKLKINLSIDQLTKKLVSCLF